MSASIADQLMERRAALINEAQEIAQKGVAEGRDLTVEEQTGFDQRIAEAGKLAERAKAIAEGENRAADLEASFRKGGAGSRESRDTPQVSPFETWARNAQIGEGFEIPRTRGSEARALLRVRGGLEARAMSATGGVGTHSVHDQLWEYAIATSQILQTGAQIINTADGNELPFPRATVHSQTSDTDVPASGPITESDATINTVPLGVAKSAFLTYVPTELVQDTTFDLEGYIARSAGRELGRRVSKKASAAAVAGFTVAGVTGPTGTSTTLGNQATVGQGADLLIDLYHSVLADYRTDAAWLMADPTAAMVRKLKTTTGDSVWERSLVAGNPGSIDGAPVFIDSNLPSPAASAKTVYFGDWSALLVRIAGGMRFERSSDFKFGNDQIAFRAIVRSGAAVIDPNAVKYFAHSAT